LFSGVEEEVGVLEDERGTPGFPKVPARDDRLHVPGASLWSPMRLRPADRSRACCVQRSIHRASRNVTTGLAPTGGGLDTLSVSRTGWHGRSPDVRPPEGFARPST